MEPIKKLPSRIAAIILTFILAAWVCLSKSGPLLTTNVLGMVPPTPTLPPDQLLIWEAWERSSHADSYDLEKGPNSYCARCHSPANWDYTAAIDPPPNCVSCKFSSEPEPRIAINNPLIPEDDWAGIGCYVCHQMEGREAAPQFAWYDNATGYYETITTTTELCEKCHVDTNRFLHHQRDLGQDVHAGFTCTDCHDPHDPYASCADIGCHQDVAAQRKLLLDQHANIKEIDTCLECHTGGMDTHTMEVQRNGDNNCLICHDYLVNFSTDELPPVEHSSVHSKVDCVACHDASGLAVGPIEGEEIWAAFRTVESPFGLVSEPYQSHNLQRTVACDRCHYIDNPWGITGSVENSR